MYVHSKSAYNYHINLCASAINCNLFKYNTNTYTFNVFSTDITFPNVSIVCDCVWSGSIMLGYVVHMERPTDIPK